MPLKIITDEHGNACPQVFCDWCGQRIERAADGNYQWVMWDNRKVVYEDAPIFTHKRCCWAFEHHNAAPHRHFGACDLQCLPIYLANNLELNWVSALKSSRIMSGFEGDFITQRLDPEKWQRVRKEVFERDKYQCQYCGTKQGPMECDHIMPVSKGGSNEMHNLVTACFDCNRSKRDKPLMDWIRELQAVRG